MSNTSTKMALAAGLGLASLAFGASAAQAGPYDYGYEYRPPVGHGQRAAPATLPLGPGFGVVSPYQRTAAGAYIQVPHYRGPDGLADNLVDVSREVNGVPCGDRLPGAGSASLGLRPGILIRLPSRTTGTRSRPACNDPCGSFSDRAEANKHDAEPV